MNGTHTVKVAFVTGGSGFVGRTLIGALVERGVKVRALARSDQASAVVAALGAEVVRGDLDDVAALTAGMTGADTVFHSAAMVDDWDPEGLADRINVVGTRNVLDAARAAGVGVVVHVSTEAVLIGGPNPVMADETWPLPERPLGVYPRTKGLAERECQRAAAEGLRVVIVRPRFVWGRDDTSVLPRLVEAAEKGMFRWFDGGNYKTSTCHVDNVVVGMLLAAERGRSGEAYFLTDGEPQVAREFVGAMLRSRGITPPTGSIPYWVGAAVARASELAWTLPLPGRPTLTRASLRLFGREVTVSDAKARRELGYAPVITVEEGLRQLLAG